MADAARILAVDDSDESLLQIELYLDGEEFSLTTARSGREAFDLLLVDDFDLILLDVAMPQLSGIEVCERLKADPRTAPIPVIFLTARMRDEADKLAAFKVGGVDYLSKPFHRDELVARIRVVLALQRERSEIEAQNHELRGRVQSLQNDLVQLRDAAAEQRALRVAERDAPRAVLVVDGERRVVAIEAGAVEPFGLRLTAGARLDDASPPWRAALLRGGDQNGGTARVTAADATRREATFDVVRAQLDARHSLIEIRDVSDVVALQRQIDDRAPVQVPPSTARTGYRINGLVGESPRLGELTALIDRLRNVRSTVLVYGETGTGKELVARALHYDGKFANRPFIPIHCGAIAPELIESELFGYEKGAFTGALSSKQGLFAAADGGTVFLDEIAETLPDLQIKLLRVLQLGEVRPVGATHAKHVDVRILAATNQDLQALVADGRFREDLFHRLDVVTVRLPPLRERVEDIPRLAQHFLERFAREHTPRAPAHELSRAAIEAMTAYPWPGNVRELENVIERAIACGCSRVLQVEDLPERIRAGAEGSPRTPTSDATPTDGSLRGRRDRTDRLALIHALARFDGDKRQAARYLGMSRSTFYRKLKQFGVG